MARIDSAPAALGSPFEQLNIGYDFEVVAVTADVGQQASKVHASPSTTSSSGKRRADFGPLQPQLRPLAT